MGRAAEGRGAREFCKAVEGRPGDLAGREVPSRHPQHLRQAAGRPSCRGAQGALPEVGVLHRCFLVRSTFLRPTRRPGAARHLIDGRLEQRRDLAALREPGEHSLLGEGAFEGALSHHRPLTERGGRL
jgi:hypothetical protein